MNILEKILIPTLAVFLLLLWVPVAKTDEPLLLPVTEGLALGEYFNALDEALDEKIDSLTELNEILAERIETQTLARNKQSREIIVEATAYCNCEICTDKEPEHPEHGITKLGFPSDAGSIAVDPKVIPLGSILWVEGYGYGIAIDTGGAIKGNKVDLFFWDHQAAKEWGRRKQVRVRVYE